MPLISKKNKILEIGAGTGWQAKALGEKGFSVTAVDIPGTQYADDRVWPVMEYDGVNLPFRAGCFDVVFSSHVLEHIAQLEQFQAEIKRVLKPDGMAIHILPSASWRFWTSICLYGHVAKKLAENLRSVLSLPALVKHNACSTELSSRRAIEFRALLPSRHGEVGNAVSELYLFSRFRWMKLFRQSGWIVQAYRPTRLFYTGYMLLHSGLSLRVRRKLSLVLGSSSHLFCLRKAGARL